MAARPKRCVGSLLWRRPGSTCSYLDCYPQSTDDDATIDEAVTVTLANVTIDDLAISNSGNSLDGPNFVGPDDLVCNSLVIAGGANAATVTTIGSGGTISTQ